MATMGFQSVAAIPDMEKAAISNGGTEITMERLPPLVNWTNAGCMLRKVTFRRERNVWISRRGNYNLSRASTRKNLVMSVT